MPTAKDKLDDIVKKKMKDGWIKAEMMIEVLAGSEDTAKRALENHMDKLDREGNTVVYKMDYKEIKKVENPMPQIKEAYSFVVDVGLVANSYEKLFMLVLTYGPSSIEILEPSRITINVGDAQGILNSISDLIHSFAAKSIGGIHIMPGKERKN